MKCLCFNPGVIDCMHFMYIFGVRRVSRRFEIFRIATRPRAALEYFGLRQFIAALISRHVSCRSCTFPIAARPLAAFDFITLSCHFGSAVRLNAVKQVPL